MIFSCCDEHRKDAVLANTSATGVNGIDYLEVLDHASPIASLRQRTLLVHCLKKAPAGLTAKNVLLLGGESITSIAIEWVAPAKPVPAQATGAEIAFFNTLPDASRVLVVRLSQYGDFSTYTLRLVEDAVAAAEDPFATAETLTAFDPQLAQIDFSFKVECGPDFDCQPDPPECLGQLPPPPPINYLAKDYLSFRQVMLDRMRQLLPAWDAGSEADIGIMLTELVAYAGDQLSYRQDAVTTEAYLTTARSRISLRRHARLVDYAVHDGANARAWVHLQVTAADGVGVFLDRTLTRFYTSAPGMPKTLEVGAGTEEKALLAGLTVFEPMQDAVLFHEHNRMQLYAWGEGNCCLPAGSTSATLKGRLSNLQVGDVLIFVEQKGPQTGFAGDADLRHRCAVRLTAVATQNHKGEPLADPLFDLSGKPIASAAQTPQPVTEIQWAAEDALPFPLCVSSNFVDSKGKLEVVKDVCVVLGNIVLADHGLRMPDSALPEVPGPNLFYAPNLASDRCHPAERKALPVRYRPVIAARPITQAVPLPLAGSPSTSIAVALKPSGSIALHDRHGFTTLLVAANSPLKWPQYFGVIARVNGINPAEFDLDIVFAPPGAAAPVVLERFKALSFLPASANFVSKTLAASRLVTVPAAYVPPAAAPAAYVAAATLLKNSAPVPVKDAGSNPFLLLEPTPAANWPALFSVMIQGLLKSPDIFNLLLLYTPKSGSNGVTLPVTVEHFDNLSLAGIGAAISAASDLITVKSFEDAPNPSLSACELMSFDASEAIPSIALKGLLNGVASSWNARPDLLASLPEDKDFVVEVETGGAASLRFGDGAQSSLPGTGMHFTASYRIGNGLTGNLGAESLTNFAAGPLADSMIASCINPMAAVGGLDPETSAQIRRRAPQAFLTQERAITMPDYVVAAERNAIIQHAAAASRWTGSWYTVFITAEPVRNIPLIPIILQSLYKTVNAYRLAGEDIEIRPPRFVSLRIELAICVAPGFFRRNVEKALLHAFAGGTQACGGSGYFSADRFVLGQPVYLSPILKAARAVAGVQTVQATVFEPQNRPTSMYLRKGFIPIGAFEVARVANDPSLPANGRLQLHMQGGL